jgi:hypothetical protein
MVSDGSVHHGGKGMAEHKSSHRGSQEAEKGEIQEGTRTSYSPKDMPPLSDLLPPMKPHLLLFHHLPIILSFYESIKGLIHSLDQSLHDLIISGSTIIDTPRSV